MFKLLKWLFRLVLAAIALVIVLAVIFLLTYNTVLRLAIQRNIRAQTGMDAEIGRFHLALTEPTIEIQNLKIFNPPDFGGAPFLNIPEVHIEYDRAALMKRKIHLTLLRLNLAELDIVKNQSGQTNIFVFAGQPAPETVATTAQTAPPKSSQPANGAPAPKPSPPENPPPQPKRPLAHTAPVSLASVENQTGFEFEKKIDVLNVSIGKLKFIDLQNPRDDREQTIGLENIVIPDVKSPVDLAGLGLMVYLRSDHFFDRLAGNSPANENSNTLKNVLNLFDAAF